MTIICLEKNICILIVNQVLQCLLSTLNNCLGGSLKDGGLEGGKVPENQYSKRVTQVPGQKLWANGRWQSSLVL